MAFKDKLALSDEDAALAHLDVGRRLLRAQYEAGSRKDDTPSRKASAERPAAGLGPLTCAPAAACAVQPSIAGLCLFMTTL